MTKGMYLDWPYPVLAKVKDLFGQAQPGPSEEKQTNKQTTKERKQKDKEETKKKIKEK